MPHKEEEGWVLEYERKGALWIHDGNPKRPHALLSKGGHSNGFFNSELVMENPRILDCACSDLIEACQEIYRVPLNLVDRVVGPAMGAITMAHDAARNISQLTDRDVLRSYAEKIGEHPNEQMIFNRTKVLEGEVVLLCEDVLTSGTSAAKTKRAVISKGGNVLPFVLCLVNRSGHKTVEGMQIVALINRDMPEVQPSECELCPLGSEAIRPKEGSNWTRLNAHYD